MLEPPYQPVAADHAAQRLALAYLDDFRIRTVSENCRDLVIVDRGHYEGLLARSAETR